MSHAAEHASEYLQLLADVGVPVTADAWRQVHGEATVEPEAPVLPSRPHHYEGPVPVFTSSQVAWAAPEVFGWETYQVIEDRETAHPWVLDYKDEGYYRTSGTRPIHRYSREARLRWTLWRLVGLAGRIDPAVEQLLQTWAREDPAETLYGRHAHEWVHAHLKTLRRPDLYASIPLLIRRLGGRTWVVSHAQLTWILERATYLHHSFNWLRRREQLTSRQRFPKMVYVFLRLLAEVGVATPYRILGVKSAYKRRELSESLAAWVAAGPYGILATTVSPLDRATATHDNELRKDRVDEPVDPRTAYLTPPGTPSPLGRLEDGSQPLLCRPPGSL